MINQIVSIPKSSFHDFTQKIEGELLFFKTSFVMLFFPLVSICKFDFLFIKTLKQTAATLIRGKKNYAMS